jgi:hypothetical protein
MINDKNQIIRSMKSYEVGGTTEDNCMETVMIDGKKRRRRKSGCGKTTKFKSSSGSGGSGKIAGAILGLGSGIAAGLGVKKMLDKNKKGGIVKARKK